MARGKRSPKYPFIPLSKALERADQLYRKETRNYAPMRVALGHWGYAPKSSGGLQTVGALIGYGLLEDAGAGQSRKVRITEHARRILLDQRPDSSERQDLIKQSALTPDIFASLWAEWRQTGIPSPENMRYDLVMHHNFNENAVDDFIRVFAETLEFSGLKNEDNQPERSDAKVIPVGAAIETDTASPIPPARAGGARRPQTSAQPESGMQESTFPLTEGLAVVQWPKAMSPESYEDFEAWVQLTLRRAKRSVVKPTEPREENGGDPGRSETSD